MLIRRALRLCLVPSSSFITILLTSSLVILWLIHMLSSPSLGTSMMTTDKMLTTDKDEKSSLCTMGGPPVPTFKIREDLGKILQNEKNFTKGVELGVQRGVYSETILSEWSNCKEYHLVDLWARQENYKDVANVNQARQDRNYEETLERLDKWKDKLHVCRNFTSTCVQGYEDEYFDFIYVDARHDFKGVWEDLIHYWPKLRVGGIMAGHDYVIQDEIRNGQDWTKNYDGTVDETRTVVKGAVDKFANRVCRQVTVSYREGHWNNYRIYYRYFALTRPYHQIIIFDIIVHSKTRLARSRCSVQRTTQPCPSCARCP